MRRPGAIVKRALIFVHRWLGVGLSALFLLWFVSGIVMMYWSFPGITARDRLERAPVLDGTRILISPEQAYAVLGREQPPGQIRLTTFDGRPAYRFSSGQRGGGGGGRRGGGPGALVFADDGTALSGVDIAMVQRAATQWTGRPTAEATREWIEEIDQWTVGGLRTRLPLHKYSWPDGQQAYVSGETAEVVQYTTSASRFWAYLGAIPHWLYFTPLRRHQQEWSSTVVWSSLIGTIAALIGVVIALWLYSPRQRYRHAGARSSIPYKGWKRWHTIVGLLFGVVTTTWVFSGLLSMGPFPIVDWLTDLTVPAETSPRDRPDRGRGAEFTQVLRRGALPLSAYAGRSPSAAIAALRGFEVKELEYTSLDGQPFYLARNGASETRVVPIRGASMTSFDAGELMRRIRSAAGGSLVELRIMDEYDAYYLDRLRERPLPVIYAQMGDAASTRFYIDPATASIVGSYSARGWVNRWLYHGLHSLDFPWLYRYRPLWDIVVIGLMLGGTAICVTSLVLTWRVLARKVSWLTTRGGGSAPVLTAAGDR